MGSRRLYRYRTGALVGPWRSRRDEAVEDAVSAGQATREQGQPGGIRWLIRGEIEEGRA